MPRNTIPFPREPPIPRASVCEERHKDIRNHSPHKIHIAPPPAPRRSEAPGHYWAPEHEWRQPRRAAAQPVGAHAWAAAPRSEWSAPAPLGAPSANVVEMHAARVGGAADLDGAARLAPGGVSWVPPGWRGRGGAEPRATAGRPGTLEPVVDDAFGFPFAPAPLESAVSVAERFLASDFAADFAAPEEATDEPPPSTLYHYQREIASSRKAAKAPPVAVAACARSRLDFEIPLPRFNS